MPRKMSGSEISRIDWLIVAMRTPSVVFDRAIHLYRSSRSSRAGNVSDAALGGDDMRDRAYHKRGAVPCFRRVNGYDGHGDIDGLPAPLRRGPEPPGLAGRGACGVRPARP